MSGPDLRVTFSPAVYEAFADVRRAIDDHVQKLELAFAGHEELIDLRDDVGTAFEAIDKNVVEIAAIPLVANRLDTLRASWHRARAASRHPDEPPAQPDEGSVEHLPRPAGWIAIADRLPDLKQSVALVHVGRWENCGGDMRRNVHACGYLNDAGHWRPYWSIRGERAQELDTFTHWFALPIPPEFEEKDR